MADNGNLPEKGKKVLLTVEWGGGLFKYTCCAYYSRSEGWYEETFNSDGHPWHLIPESHKILAWRYIEEYEE